MTHQLGFTRNFTTDFNVAVQGLRRDYDGPPYAFVRFADGEADILRGLPYRAVSDRWHVSQSMPNLQRRLEAAIRCDLFGWCVGITAGSHHPRDHEFLLRKVLVPSPNISFAELFIFGNWDRFLSIDIDHCRVIGNGAEKLGVRGHQIPPNAVQNDEFDYEGVVSWMMRGTGPILLSAGPLAKTIAHEYWAEMCRVDLRQDVVIDVGSALSPFLRGRRTRRYHSGGSPERSRIPTWKMPE